MEHCHKAEAEDATPELDQKTSLLAHKGGVDISNTK